MEQIYKDRNAALADALDSGDYQQGKKYLHLIINGTGKHEWCCLGVASDLAVKDGVEMNRTLIADPGYRGGVQIEWFGGDSSFPPRRIACEYYGWESYDPQLLAESGEMVQASVLNDDGDGSGEPYDFHRIAEAFRRTFVNAE